MNKNCKWCEGEFTIFEEDKEYYKKIGPEFGGEKYEVPFPDLCPDCRQKRRLTVRNERNFYKRKCDLTGEDMVSTYRPEFPGKVYSQDAFWGDGWDGRDAGREFDFSRPFFDQFAELCLEAPRIAMVNMSSENSLYTNHSAYNKNCYMCINTGWCEDLIYCSNYCLYNKNSTDCTTFQKCELCYFCIDCRECFNCSYCYECKNTSESHFCYDCHGCQNCFGCYNLRHKQYCVNNEQLSKEDYEEKLKELMPNTWREYASAYKNFKEMIRDNAIHRYIFGDKNQNSTGDQIDNNKNVKDSFFTFGSEDCRYCYDTGEAKDFMDVVEPFKGELQYECHGCNMGYQLIGCVKCYDICKYLNYCQYCWACEHCFGCIGLKRAKYCILNKQYTEEEYNELVPRIIEHMKKTGATPGGGQEWGNFPPPEISPFAYNETTANDYYPMTKEDVLAQGLKWHDEVDKTYDGQGFIPLERIEQVGDEILDKVIKCEVTGRPFRIVKKELDFYKRMGFPIPLRHPDQRFKDRMALRNPRKLWDRQCTKCSVDMRSSFEPSRSEKVYCEKCYLESVY